MALLHTYNSTHLSTVRDGTITLSQMAEMGQIGSGSIAIDDTTGNIAIVGQKDYLFTESSCSLTRTFRGYVVDRAYGRDAGVERKPHVGAGRGIAVNLEDLNSMLGHKGITGNDGKRPAETVAARGAWLMASDYWPAIIDNGRVDFPSDVGMDAADYFQQDAMNVLSDMAMATTTHNFHVQDYGSGPELIFRNDNSSTADSSTLRISNVAADVDSDHTTVGATKTFAPSVDATLNRKPGRVVSKLTLSYARGSVTRDRDATATTYNGERYGTATNSNVRTSGRAIEEAEAMLDSLSTEEDIIEVEILVPSSQVNLLMAGYRIEAKFSHFATEGYGSFTWFRVLERTVVPVVAEGTIYRLRLRLSPQEDLAPANPFIQIVTGRSTEGGVVLTFPNPVTIGNILVCVISDRGRSDPPSPNIEITEPRWGAGAWTKLPNNVAAATFGSGVAIWTKTADSTEQDCFLGATQSVFAVYEIAGATFTGAATDFQNNGAAAVTMNMGNLADGLARIMVIAYADQKNISDPAFPTLVPADGWIVDIMGPAFFGGVTQWEDPITVIAHALSTGGVIAASATRSALLHHDGGWAGAALSLPAA